MKDIVALDRSLTANHKRIIMTRLGEGFIPKHLQIITGSRRIFLKFEQPNYPVIEVTSCSDFEIFGVVSCVSCIGGRS